METVSVPVEDAQPVQAEEPDPVQEEPEEQVIELGG